MTVEQPRHATRCIDVIQVSAWQGQHAVISGTGCQDHRIVVFAELGEALIQVDARVTDETYAFVAVDLVELRFHGLGSLVIRCNTVAQ